MPVETVEAEDVRAGEFAGSAVKRREDPHLLTGEARYTDDVQYPRMAHLALLGSQYGHAEIGAIDTSAAEDADGVLAVYTHDDLLESGIEGTMPAADPENGVAVERPLLARERVRYQGQPVAAVVAEGRYDAFRALDLIEVEYDRLEAAPELEDALAEGAPRLHDAAEGNVCFESATGDEAATEEAFSDADHTVALTVANNRVIPTAMEPRAAVAQYRKSEDALIVELSSQNPHSVQDRLSSVLDVPEHRVTVRVPDVGGGFGAKLQPYSGHLLSAWCAMALERPVKWQARRTDDFQSMVHARHQETEIEAALSAEGDILGLRGHIDADLGGYATGGGVGIPRGTAAMLCGQYDVPAGHVSVRGVFTNTAPISAYRGAGRPEAAYVIERLASACARELEIDPAEFRRRNFIPSEEFPVETALGRSYDSGDYEKTLDRALEIVGYDGFRQRQEAAREEGKYLGIGFSSYVEVCGGSSGDMEGGLVRMNPEGGVVVGTGTQDTGQGHATSFAQVVADELGVDYDAVEVIEGDTDRVPEGGGTAGSRSLPMGGGALREAAGRLVEKGRTIAAHQLEASEADIEFDDGEFRVRGVPDRTVTIEAVAEAAYSPGDLPEGVDAGMEETAFFTPEGSTAPFGTHVAIVEVDPDTGELGFERYVAVDDVGTQINPKLVEGQIKGGVAQGIGQAVYEEGRYDENANLATGSLQDYAMPKSWQLPEVEWESTETPSPNNPLGAKGVGEAGTIAAMPAVVNAAIDALSPFGVDDLDAPLSEETLWRAARG
ncbi:xanthine dehydrogenase family protein molybdopterin-binding subunit [Saliphagus sp. LR7]|uniref:xanthine dehydrogenase family protein molybdopterin-binding subunit n=1 Tax=Saliphagus sp. LR7 TaxID=2282654 RepID=UPI000DF72D49|nr:xanthine dehydrogenase family protein molybdopterin-binding subunit [Saliphagus sp. LR7]